MKPKFDIKSEYHCSGCECHFANPNVIVFVCPVCGASTDKNQNSSHVGAYTLYEANKEENNG